MRYGGAWPGRPRAAPTEEDLLSVTHRDAAVELCRRFPESAMRLAGMEPDPWQVRALASETDLLMMCSRQVGKSSTASAMAIRTALANPGLILLISPTLRQSGELFRDKVMRLYAAMGRPVPLVQETALTMSFVNGSRIVSLPGDERNIRGYSDVKLLVVDEAARVPDELYSAVRPMLATSKGRMVALSTPFGKRGWFYEAWAGPERFERVEVRADECPRISTEFLDGERRKMGARWFNQEFLCSFEDSVGQVFASDDIMAAVSDDVTPLAVA